MYTLLRTFHVITGLRLGVGSFGK